MKITSLMIMSGLMFFSCSEKNTESPITEKLNFKQARLAAGDENNELKKVIKAHSILMKKLHDEKISKKFNPSKNKQLLLELSQCRSKEATEKVFLKFGLKNGKNVVESFETIRKTMVKEVSKHPEMQFWSEKEKKAYLDEMFKKQ